MKIGFINTAKTIEVFVNGNCYTVLREDPRYMEVVDAIIEQDADLLEDILQNDIGSALNKKANKIKFPGLSFGPNGEVLWNDVQIHGTMVDRMLENQKMGLPIDGIFKFIERIMKTENAMLIEDLYTFLEYGKLPITEDGTFWAYKVVRADFTDKYTGTMDNSVGTVVEMPRESVDQNRNNTCSSGLHFCSFDYISAFYSPGDRLVKVEVAPEDVVSIPTDYNNTKARACRYTIVEDLTELMKPVDSSKMVNVLAVKDNNITQMKEQLREAVQTLRNLQNQIENLEADLSETLEDVDSDFDLDEDGFDLDPTWDR